MPISSLAIISGGTNASLKLTWRQYFHVSFFLFTKRIVSGMQIYFLFLRFSFKNTIEILNECKMTSVKVLLVCIQFKWDAASDSNTVNCQTLTRWLASAGEHFNPGSARTLWQGCAWHAADMNYGYTYPRTSSVGSGPWYLCFPCR